MNRRRTILLLLQAAALVVVPLFLEVSWSRQIYNANETVNYAFDDPLISMTSKNIDPAISTGNETSTQSGQSDIETNQKSWPPLQIAWLMSFPNSGTSYTSHFVRKVTQTKTATNYAELKLSQEVRRGLEAKESIPVYEDQPTGPFWVDGDEAEPTSGFVLTKTHCGALCVWCAPEKYTQMIHHFRHRCLRSDKMRVVNGTKTITKSMYPPTRVAKAVHLIRDPLDNVVSRFRYEQTNGRSALGYNSTREDFRTYCKRLNSEFLGEIKQGRYIQPEIGKLIEKVPCHAEIMKWVEFHNMAFIVTEDLYLETFVLHYEDYSTRFEHITSELLAFLHLNAIDEPPKFQAFKEYKEYYTVEERGAVALAVRAMALRETWVHVSRYFA